MATGVRYRRFAVLGLAVCALIGCQPAQQTDSEESHPASELPSRAMTLQPTPGTTAAPAAWTEVDVDGFDVRGMAEGAGRVVAVGATRPDGMVWIATSSDGKRFTSVALPKVAQHVGNMSTVAFGPGGFVATGGWCENHPSQCHPINLRSTDGVNWEQVTLPAACFRFSSLDTGVLTGVWGYVIVAGSCIGEDEIDPRPFRVLKSVDGVEWTSTAEIAAFSHPDRWPGPIATDGRRLIAVQAFGASQEPAWITISDDAGLTWRTLDHAVDPAMTLNSLTYGHGLWLAAGGQIVPEDQPERVMCASPDGENWTCDTNALGYLGMLTATPTGFVGLTTPITAQPSRSQSLQSTSSDGIEWRQEAIARWDLSYYGIAATSYGIFAWGGTYPDTDPTGFSTPFVLVHSLPLP